MKIALFHYSAWPAVGGVETVLMEHARLFAGDGHEVVVFSAGSSAEEAPGTAGVRMEWYPELPPRKPSESGETLFSSRLPGEFTRRHAELRAFLRSRLEGFHAVFIHNILTMPFDLPLTAALWDVVDAFPATRFIAWVHDLADMTGFCEAAEPQIPWNLLGRMHPRVEYVAVSGSRRLEACERLECPAERIAVIPNGIDVIGQMALTPRVEELAKTFRLIERELVLFHPTRLLYRKNVELGLQVTKALIMSGVDAVLLITGAKDRFNAKSVEYAGHLHELRTALKLDEQVIFLNDESSVQEEDVASLYRVCDALFFPSRQEGFGIPMIEAAIHRIPAFCGDLPPLNAFPWARPINIEAPPPKIAGEIMRQISGSPSIQARKAVSREYSWPAIWRNFLAPLLYSHKTDTTHENLHG